VPEKPDECEHQFTFLRQEERLDEGYYRPVRHVFDVFFCAKCLEYRKKEVAQIVPNGFDSGYTRRNIE
jgi:hypothetical protein